MGGIGIVINPHSRQNRKHPERIHKLGYILGDRGSCESTTDSLDIVRVAEEFKAREVEILALSGGDGTNHVTLTAFINVYGATPLPKIALLRGGTMNTIANACGIKGETHGILADLVEKYHTGQKFETTFRDIMKIEDHYGFIFGNGMVHNFLAEYYDCPEPSPKRAVETFAHGVVSGLVGGPFAARFFRPFRARVTVDGRRWPYDEYTAMVASTISQIGLGFTPFHRCEERPGTFHIVGILCKPFGFVTQTPRIYLGWPTNPRKLFDAVAEEVIFEAEEDMSYTIDGDTHEAGKRMRLGVGPRLELIVR